MDDEATNDETGPDRAFVYGTLMPGHSRWEILAPRAGEAHPATVEGWLWDTGR